MDLIDGCVSYPNEPLNPYIVIAILIVAVIWFIVSRIMNKKWGVDPIEWE